jgi:hypothetical protein
MASCADRGLRRKRVDRQDVSAVSAAPYPRRQQAYRLKRAAGSVGGAVAITAAGLTAALAGLTALAVVFLLTAGAVGLYARLGRGWPTEAGSGHAPKTRCARRSKRSSARAGGCATRSPGSAAATSITSRSHRPASPSPSRPRPAPTTRCTSRRSTSRRPGCAVIVGAGARTDACQSSASRAGASSRSSTTSSSSPSIASWKRYVPHPGPAPGRSSSSLTDHSTACQDTVRSASGGPRQRALTWHARLGIRSSRRRGPRRVTDLAVVDVHPRVDVGLKQPHRSSYV